MKQKLKQLLLFLPMFFCISIMYAQDRQVTGTVTNESGTPLANVSYLIKGTTTGGVTSDAGKYSVKVSSPADVLVFTLVSYKKAEVTVGTRSTIDVVMVADAGSLEEVVVTALGIKREKKSLGYAVEQISGSTIVDAHETNLANALSGKVAGLQVVKGSTGAGGSSKLVLRGYNSLGGSNQPLIVVDGIPLENFTGANNNDFFNPGLDFGNGLADINPDDIANISVLKGQSASALYGARGGNGVIMITTKGGRKQPGLGINVSSTLSVEGIFLKPEFQNSYAQGSNGIFNAELNDSWGPKIEGQSVTKWDGTQSKLATYDNVDAFTRKGTSQNHGLSFQQQYGGTSVYSSVNYLEDKSIIPGNKLTRTNISSRVTSRFGNDDRWTTDFKIAYNNTAGYNRPLTGKDRSSVYAIYMLPRSMDIRDFRAGSDEFGKMLWYPGALAWTPNPYWASRNILNNDTRDRFLLNGSVRYNFTDWLNAEIKGGADIYGTNTEGKTYTGGSLANSYSTGKQSFTETNYSAIINAQKENLFGKIGGSLMIGGNLMDHKWSSLSVSTGELEVPNLFSPTNAKGIPSISAGVDHKKINSVFGSVELNYDKWVYLTFTNRNDWTSTLIEDNRSYSYPSVSLSYVLTDMLESMGSSAPQWMNYFKLRGSYASVGNDMGAYRLYNGYLISKDPLGHTVAEKENLLKNPNVKNELLKSTELGAEMRFINNRIGVDFTWYKSNATNQLIELPMDPMSGYSRRIINAGNIQNKGIELMVDGRILENPAGLNWSLRFNYSNNENKIIDIAKDSGVSSYTLGSFDNLSIRAVNGGLYGDIYGTKFLRVETPGANFGALLLDNLGLPQATPSSSYLGNQQAKSLYGIANTFSYKNVELFFLVDARMGGKIFSATQTAMQGNGTAAITAPGGNRENFVVDGVISDGSGGFSKSTVEVSQQDYWKRIATTGNLGIGEANIYDASSVRLRNVMLSYTLPKGTFGNVIQRARISASCNNVWMIKSHLRGIDPESVFATGTNAIGLESGAYPTMRTFQFSLNLGF